MRKRTASLPPLLLPSSPRLPVPQALWHPLIDVLHIRIPGCRRGEIAISKLGCGHPDRASGEGEGVLGAFSFCALASMLQAASPRFPSQRVLAAARSQPELPRFAASACETLASKAQPGAAGRLLCTADLFSTSSDLQRHVSLPTHCSAVDSRHATLSAGPADSPPR